MLKPTNPPVLYAFENSFSKTTKQRIKKANDLGVDVRLGDIKDIKSFYDLMSESLAAFLVSDTDAEYASTMCRMPTMRTTA